MLYRMTQTLQRIILRVFFVYAHGEAEAEAKARLAQNRLSTEEKLIDSEILEETCEVCNDNST